MTVVNAI